MKSSSAIVTENSSKSTLSTPVGHEQYKICTLFALSKHYVDEGINILVTFMGYLNVFYN